MTPDINKVRAGLRYCMEPNIRDGCDICSYSERPYRQQGCGMFSEALALLDELEAARKIVARQERELEIERATLADIDKYVKELKEAVRP